MGLDKKEKNMKIVFAAGTWDLFHVGHLNIIRRAKKLGDFLVVGVSTDKLVKQYKNHAPVIPYKKRYEIVKAIRYVDKVIPLETMDKGIYIKQESAHTLVAGDDWSYLKGQEMAKEVVFLPRTKGVSSSMFRKYIEAGKNVLTKEELLLVEKNDDVLQKLQEILKVPKNKDIIQHAKNLMKKGIRGN